MKCCNCSKEMKKGFLFTTKDGAFSFGDEVPGVFSNAKNISGFAKNNLLPGRLCGRVFAFCAMMKKYFKNYLLF